MRSLYLISVGVMALAVFSGCNSLTTTAPGESYPLKRSLLDYQTMIGQPIDSVHEAVLKGLKDLELRPVTDSVDKLSGMVQGVMSDGMSYQIKLAAITPKATRLSIRCGTFCNAERTRLIFAAIEKHL